MGSFYNPFVIGIQCVDCDDTDMHFEGEDKALQQDFDDREGRHWEGAFLVQRFTCPSCGRTIQIQAGVCHYGGGDGGKRDSGSIEDP